MPTFAILLPECSIWHMGTPSLKKVLQKHSTSRLISKEKMFSWLPNWNPGTITVFVVVSAVVVSVVVIVAVVLSLLL